MVVLPEPAAVAAVQSISIKMEEALIIFVRNPELGKVKTRLAKDIGDIKALEIYRELLQVTHDTAYPLSQDKFLFYDSHKNLHDDWSNTIFNKRIQQGVDLGERMLDAFSTLFHAGYKRIIIIGSDCPYLTTAHLQKAFEELRNIDAVIGPATDGGYYLLGLNKPHTSLFSNIKWSTGSVYGETVKVLGKLNQPFVELEALPDIDNIEDWQRYKRADLH